VPWSLAWFSRTVLGCAPPGDARNPRHGGSLEAHRSFPVGGDLCRAQVPSLQRSRLPTGDPDQGNVAAGGG
jgi:hypothetical protein